MITNNIDTSELNELAKNVDYIISFDAHPSSRPMFHLKEWAAHKSFVPQSFIKEVSRLYYNRKRLFVIVYDPSNLTRPTFHSATWADTVKAALWTTVHPGVSNPFALSSHMIASAAVEDWKPPNHNHAIDPTQTEVPFSTTPSLFL